MSWVLILIVNVHGTIDHISFNDRKSCEAALVWIDENGKRGVEGKCFRTTFFESSS